MNLRLKLTMSFLLISALTTGAVGATAWWMVMRNFRGEIREQAFNNFKHDVQDYVTRYGSWAAGLRVEPFNEFVNRRHRDRPFPSPPPERRDNPISPPGHAPFRFLLLTPEGKAVSALGAYARGESVPEQVRRQGMPIIVQGRTVLIAVPLGEPVLTAQERRYLALIRDALLIGMGVAALLAIVLGTILSGRHVKRVRELVEALERMQPEGDTAQQVPVRSRDEIGLLAQTFNRMSRYLTDAHRELQESNRTIRGQAEKLREQSLRDPLTGLHNRRYFDEQAERMYQRAVRYQRPLAVMVADIDHFKSVNDNFSHAIGDEVLSTVAEILQRNIRSSDLLARYGGEEFVAIFDESSLAQAKEHGERLRQCIEQADWAQVAPGLKVTLSIGLCDALALGSIEAMLNCADGHMYEAKALGRNRVEPAS